MMRAALLIVPALAACFDPRSQPGQPCIDWCPPPETCIQGVCGGGPSPDGPPIVSVAGNYIFVTSERRTVSELAGVEGADAWCNRLASAAGLDGSYLAWTAGAYDRLFALASRSWYRVDGKPVADGLDDLAAGNILYPPLLTERGENLTVGESFPLVGTGTYDGSVDVAGFDCAGLTSTVGFLIGGFADAGTLDWTAGTMQSITCADPFRMYCVGTDRSEVVIIGRPPSYRYAFVTETTEPVSSLADFDTQCLEQAAFAGLGIASARAWISTAGQAANDRVPDGEDWIRVDGVLAMTGDKSRFVSAINVTADGQYLTGFAWSGTADPGNAAGSADDTCGDWTTQSAQSTDAGAITRSIGRLAFGGSPLACLNEGYVYCLEE